MEFMKTSSGGVNDPSLLPDPLPTQRTQYLQSKRSCKIFHSGWVRDDFLKRKSGERRIRNFSDDWLVELFTVMDIYLGFEIKVCWVLGLNLVGVHLSIFDGVPIDGVPLQDYLDGVFINGRRWWFSVDRLPIQTVFRLLMSGLRGEILSTLFVLKISSFVGLFLWKEKFLG